MKTKLVIHMAVIVCLLCTTGCSGKHKLRVQKKLASMPDRELVNHYEMLEMRMEGIDRARAQTGNENRKLRNSHYPPDYQNRLKHLHIGDDWNRLKKEKQLTLIEMRKRGIIPP